MRPALIPCTALMLTAWLAACAPGKEAASPAAPVTPAMDVPAMDASAADTSSMAGSEETPMAGNDAPMETNGSQDTTGVSDANGASMKAPVAEPGLATECNAEPAQGFVGKVADDATVAAARTAANVTSSVRVIKPGQAVTMDFRHDRLNIAVDDNNVIVRINCG